MDTLTDDVTPKRNPNHAFMARLLDNRPIGLAEVAGFADWNGDIETVQGIMQTLAEMCTDPGDISEVGYPHAEVTLLKEELLIMAVNPELVEPMLDSMISSLSRGQTPAKS